MRKIFVIGFNKTATTTFHSLFKTNGLKSQHTTKWETDKYNCFSDNGNLNDFKSLDRKYSNSLFILNTRSLNKWLISRFEHGVRKKNKPNWAYPYTTKKAIKWIKDRDSHYTDVLNYFLDKPEKLIIINIENPNWIPFICKTLNLPKNKVKSRGVFKKSAHINKIKTTINQAFKTLNYNKIQRTEILIENKDKYLQTYKNNIIIST